jgi:hypothetical protein
MKNPAPNKQTAFACLSSTVPTCPAAILLVDVTGNSPTTMFTQLQPDPLRGDDETYSAESTSSRIQKQRQIEDDFKGMLPSSSTQPSQPRTLQHPNFTHANIERHADQHSSAPKNRENRA